MDRFSRHHGEKTEVGGKGFTFVENEKPTTDPAQDKSVLYRKMKVFVKRMDLDQDGLLTKKDFEHLAQRYAEVGKLDHDRAKLGLKQLCLIWDVVFAEGTVEGKLDANQMTQMLLKKGHDTIVSMATVAFSFIFGIVDKDGNGFINKENFRLYHRMLRVENEADTKKAFEAIDKDGDGRISFMEFIEAGVDFYLSNDESSSYNVLLGPLKD